MVSYFKDVNMDVINMSLGGTSGGLSFQQAVNQAYANNIVLIAATGNDGNEFSVSYPARFNNVIAVGSVGQTNIISDFSIFLILFILSSF